MAFFTYKDWNFNAKSVLVFYVYPNIIILNNLS